MSTPTWGRASRVPLSPAPCTRRRRHGQARRRAGASPQVRGTREGEGARSRRSTGSVARGECARRSRDRGRDAQCEKPDAELHPGSEFYRESAQDQVRVAELVPEVPPARRAASYERATSSRPPTASRSWRCDAPGLCQPVSRPSTARKRPLGSDDEVRLTLRRLRRGRLDARPSRAPARQSCRPRRPASPSAAPTPPRARSSGTR